MKIKLKKNKDLKLSLHFFYLHFALLLRSGRLVLNKVPPQRPTFSKCKIFKKALSNKFLSIPCMLKIPLCFQQY